MNSKASLLLEWSIGRPCITITGQTADYISPRPSRVSPPGCASRRIRPLQCGSNGLSWHRRDWTVQPSPVNGARLGGLLSRFLQCGSRVRGSKLNRGCESFSFRDHDGAVGVNVGEFVDESTGPIDFQ